MGGTSDAIRQRKKRGAGCTRSGTGSVTNVLLVLLAQTFSESVYFFGFIIIIAIVVFAVVSLQMRPDSIPLFHVSDCAQLSCHDQHSEAQLFVFAHP